MELFNSLYFCIGVTFGAVLMYLLIFIDKIWIKIMKFFHKKR
jgi:hypothetical protein